MLDRRNKPRTHYIHSISYTTQERIVGTFVLAAVAILMWLMLSSSVNTDLFEDYLTIYGEMESSKAVDKDTDISISGISVGKVSSVEITDDNQIVLSMNILKKYHNLLRIDSKAQLSSFDFAVLGKSFIDITPGTSGLPLLEDGSTIKIRESLNINNLVKKIGPIISALESSLNKTDKVLSVIRPEQIGSIIDNMDAASKNLIEISDEIANGKGIAHSTIYDTDFDKDLRITLDNAQDASVKVNQLLDSLNELTARMPELLGKIDPLLKEADKTLKASQRIWPLSSAVGEQESKQTLIAPESGNE